MLDTTAIQAEAYTTACAKGWHERPLVTDGVIDHDRVLAKIALMHSEIGEAVDAAGADELEMYIDPGTGKPEGFVVEIADLILRICDTCEALARSPVRHALLGLPPRDTSETPRILRDVFKSARRELDRATEVVRVDGWAGFDFRMGSIITLCEHACARMGLDLDGAVAAKMAYNKTRPHRHGGKQA